MDGRYLYLTAISAIWLKKDWVSHFLYVMTVNAILIQLITDDKREAEEGDMKQKVTKRNNNAKPTPLGNYMNDMGCCERRSKVINRMQGI